MATNNVHIPEDLLEAVETAAHAEGKTSEEWLSETIRAHIADRSWQELASQSQPLIGTVSDAELEIIRADYRKEHSTRRR